MYHARVLNCILYDNVLYTITILCYCIFGLSNNLLHLSSFILFFFSFLPYENMFRSSPSWHSVKHGFGKNHGEVIAHQRHPIYRFGHLKSENCSPKTEQIYHFGRNHRDRDTNEAYRKKAFLKNDQISPSPTPNPNKYTHKHHRGWHILQAVQATRWV